LEKVLIRSHAIIVVSEQLKSDTIKFCPLISSKVSVIPNGVDLDKIKNTNAYRHHRDYVFFAGRFHRVKDIETLLRAFSLVNEKTKDLDLLLAGEGEQKPNLQKLTEELGIEDQVYFLGEKKRDEIFSLLKGCRFFVLPSKAEGNPQVLIEALAAGKLAIVSNVKGNLEVIRHHENGLLFQQGNEIELAEYIIKYWFDNDKYGALTEKIERCNLSEYEIENMFRRHHAVYCNQR